MSTDENMKKYIKVIKLDGFNSKMLAEALNSGRVLDTLTDKSTLMSCLSLASPRGYKDSDFEPGVYFFKKSTSEMFFTYLDYSIEIFDKITLSELNVDDRNATFIPLTVSSESEVKRQIELFMSFMFTRDPDGVTTYADVVKNIVNGMVYYFVLHDKKLIKDGIPKFIKVKVTFND